MSKTYWAVHSAYRDYGYTSATIVDCIEADEKPASTMKSSRHADHYIDWYESREEAEEAVRKVKGIRT